MGQVFIISIYKYRYCSYSFCSVTIRGACAFIDLCLTGHIFVAACGDPERGSVMQCASEAGTLHHTSSLASQRSWLGQVNANPAGYIQREQRRQGWLGLPLWCGSNV